MDEKLNDETIQELDRKLKVVEERRRMVLIGTKLFEAWDCGFHNDWGYTVGQNRFNELVEGGFAERHIRLSRSPAIYGWRLTPRGLHALTKLQDALTEGLR